MKILFAIQATGNGHISRAREVIPYLQQYGELDLLTSGIQADVKLPYPIKYNMHGTSFIFGKNGGVAIWKTIQTIRLGKLYRDIRKIPVEDYDIVINDFEMITAYACKQKGLPCIGLSHQGAFLSAKTPRPSKRVGWGEWIFRNYSPTTKHIAFHFERYDDFIRTPIIRSEIRNEPTAQKDHIAVYLPAIDDKKLVGQLSQIKEVRWKVFSKHTKEHYIHENVEVFPVNNQGWITALATAEGALLGAGFEAPAEALFLGKKLLIIPMSVQYEQQCNAAGIEAIGVKVMWKRTKNFVEEVRDWVRNVKPIKVDYPDETEAIIKEIFDEL